MFTSRPKPTTASLGPMKQYATRGENIPLQKNWMETWCTLPEAFDVYLQEILEFEVRKDDVFVVTFMKCGTTWMQETAWLLMNNLDFDKSKREFLLDRSVFIENHGVVKGTPNGVKLSQKIPSPRLLKSHLPASLLPQQVWQRKQKVELLAVVEIVIYIFQNVLP
ncbi:sulfotransferase 1 family member D1-like [Stomoxys calcitrans]|uniref:sulfotransferase 1 family member D1-like n=1 Tax=Stomoxys calcitrans TaxID=35570 RepID=UPI0027E31239|nr:sulfotransferase 1 family member D1-like [Stomoxys calcitrans]